MKRRESIGLLLTTVTFPIVATAVQAQDGKPFLALVFGDRMVPPREMSALV
jgi:hypothetical protein